MQRYGLKSERTTKEAVNLKEYTKKHPIFCTHYGKVSNVSMFFDKKVCSIEIKFVPLHSV